MAQVLDGGNVVALRAAEKAAPQALPLEIFDNPMFGTLASVAQSIGSADFYHVTASWLASCLGCERYLVMRYTQYSRPQYLVNESMPSAATHLYLSSIYRIDPLLRMVRTEVTDRVMTFERLKKSDTDTLFYDENFRTAQILDELVVMLPAVGGVWTAICLDRHDECFTQGEVDAVSNVYPIVEQLHGLHIERCVFGWRGGFLNDSQIALMMVDVEGNTVFRNENWAGGVSKSQERRIKQWAGATTSGDHSLDYGIVVHWGTLDPSNAVAPDGKVFILEEQAPGYVDLVGQDMVQRFAAFYGLTPRETEIVSYVLRGHPSTAIAEKMSVSVGTIRNHRSRLYLKLDITTERELFCLFMDMSLNKRDSAT